MTDHGQCRWPSNGSINASITILVNGLYIFEQHHCTFQVGIIVIARFWNPTPSSGRTDVKANLGPFQFGSWVSKEHCHLVQTTFRTIQCALTHHHLTSLRRVGYCTYCFYLPPSNLFTACGLLHILFLPPLPHWALHPSPLLVPLSTWGVPFFEVRSKLCLLFCCCHSSMLCCWNYIFPGFLCHSFSHLIPVFKSRI